MNAVMAMPTQTRRGNPRKRLGPLHEPAAFVDGPNQYHYVGGDPVGAVDPMGLDTIYPGKPEYVPKYVPTTQSSGAASVPPIGRPAPLPPGSTLAVVGPQMDEKWRQSPYAYGYPLLAPSLVARQQMIDAIPDELDGWGGDGMHAHYWAGGGSDVRLGDFDTGIIRRADGTAAIRAHVVSQVGVQLRGNELQQGVGGASGWASGHPIGVGSCEVRVDYAWRRTPEGGARITAFYSVQDRFTFSTYGVQRGLGSRKGAMIKQGADWILWTADFAAFLPLHWGLTWGEPFDMFTYWIELTDVPCQAQSGAAAEGGGGGGGGGDGKPRMYSIDGLSLY